MHANTVGQPAACGLGDRLHDEHLDPAVKQSPLWRPPWRLEAAVAQPVAG
ncbi:hypothetical protein WEB32_00840 [Streptomyces netropsis]|uniref:Uncharacterized protein n=1 Tax=Streptomyces netropsis TaxID=55404 RepID=A0A7W7LD85_STRNE|nr:hypothetical protein [Streptomyces netropsis]MBB4888069.1 hypothetical protein [Streptomyces netropsis]